MNSGAPGFVPLVKTAPVASTLMKSAPLREDPPDVGAHLVRTDRHAEPQLGRNHRVDVDRQAGDVARPAGAR